MLVQKFRELFPELEIRGRATFKQPGLAGWYDKRTKVVRAYPRGIATYGHEIAHGISNLLDRSGKRPISETLPLTVGQEFQTVGRELYPDAKDAPAHFFMEEGFAEFVTGYICGKDVGATAPKALEWLNGEFADKNPDYRTRIEKMKLAISDYRNQAPEKAVRAFWSHEEPAIASGLRWTKRALGNAKGRWVDDAYWMLDDMRKAGIDVDLTSKNLSKEERTQAILHHPYILATMTKKSSGARTAFMALTETTDLLGSKVTGEGLSDVLAPVKNDLDRFLDYGVARVAQIYHERGMESGLSPAEVDATVRKYQSDLFDKTLDDVTSWSRRILHLMVEGGALTQEEFNKIEKDNAVYLPFMRKFLEGEISASAERAGKKGNGLLRRKGGVQSIQDPIAAMLMNAQSQIQKAQQSAVLKAIVQTYDDAMRSNRTDTNIAEWMVEVPAQQVKGDNRAEELKAEYIRMMEEKAGMTREQAEKEFNRNRTLNTLLSPWRTAQEYIGKDKIVSVVIDGKRRWFEVKDQRMMDFINGMGEKLDDNAIMQFSRKLTNSIRWGATMLNARFGLLRNPLRDTQTTALFADYHTHIPVISTLAGIIKHLEGGELSEQYERAGVGIDTTSAATLGQAQNLRGQVVARNKAERAFRAGVFKTVADVLGVTEIGPRIMEFQGAYNYWYKRTGSHEAATMMATAAAADVTVNFRRSGSFSSTASQLVLFLNAGIQSIDKFGRATGVLKALPWEKNQKRIARLGKVAGRALLTQTLVNMASYLLLKDDDDWQNLPAHEKYGYFHIRMWNGQLMRIPLPFEPGLLFGSLPVAICEQISGQNDNAVKEWAGVATGNLPIQVGGVKELASNLTPITPLVEILANEDWKGAQIVPTHVKDSREEKDWINTRTHEASKRLGAAIYKVVKDTKFAGAASPAYLEHVVDGYTGGMARGLLECVDMANDPSGIGANSDWSTIPVLGTLFVPRGMDRRTSDFYDERRRLERRANADDATPEEKGRYEAYRIFGQNALSPLLKRKRELMTDKELTAGERKQRIDETTAAVIERLADFYQDRAK